MTKVVNKNKEKYDYYIGRGSLFGNPYVIGRDGTRDEVINRYKEWFDFLIRDINFKREVLKLKDKTLGCFCAPARCHGEIIANYLDSLPE